MKQPTYFSQLLFALASLLSLGELHAAVNASSPECTWLNSRATSYQMVYSASDLQSAVNNAGWGKMIELAANRDFNFAPLQGLKIYSKDTLYVCGPKSAKIRGAGWWVTGDKTVDRPYGVHILSSRNVLINGFTVENIAKGVVTDFSNNNTIQDLLVKDIGHEGIHIRSNSSSNAIINNKVDNTGLQDASIGEGIYLGSSKNWWGKQFGNLVIPYPDRSNWNTVRGNDVKNTRAEPIDIKEGTEGGTIDSNYLNGWLLSGSWANSATSCIDAKAVNYTIQNNTCWLGNANYRFIEVHDLGSGSWGNRVINNTVYGGSNPAACYVNASTCGSNNDFWGNNFSRSCQCSP